ncbi:phosphatase PAP2 family protein [Acinetobacter variabilis]|uniref:phosphatase PAP2 family protein n=1 Tax=Acinetobacter variabilis TaxID=70346 RepID=UPI0028A2A94D|nr:phosphatase PAP2 family protein [Acinetobacter variabilis]
MSSERSRFLLNQILLLSFSFLLLWNFFDVGGVIDLKLIYPFIDGQGQFPLRQDWALAELNHRYIKDLLILVYIVLFIGWMVALKWQSWHKRRWELGYFFIMVVLTTGIIGIIKSQSVHACPWDMVTPTSNGFLWDFSATAGHCFPGGHASSGFALMTGYFVYRTVNRQRAYFFLIAAAILGFAMGWAQMMLGAHFLSHNLWTGWVIWCINIIGYVLFSHKMPVEKNASLLASIKQP